MMKLSPGYSSKTGWLAVLGITLGNLSGLRLAANPAGAVVTQGSAVVTSQGSQLTVQTSGNALINWRSFNIGAGETTTFIQPSASSVVWNRINDANPSQILGHLDANGLVVLQNSSGFYVGGQAAISTAGLIMTTSPMPPPDLAGGGAWQFNAPPPSAKIINYGQINSGTGGSMFLIADAVENHGTISAPGGNIGLYAGKEVMVSTQPDGRGLSAKVTLPEGSVDNTGHLIADAGTIALNAKVVNQSGVIQVNSIRERNGMIELLADDQLNLAASSVISANGDSQGASPGGTVTLKSGNQFNDNAGSTISVAGGVQGGNGGVVEISAPSLTAINSQIDGHASAGSQGGRLVIDPTDINLNNTGADSAGTGIVTVGSSAGTLNLNVGSSVDGSLSAFTGFSQIDLQATHNITVASGTTWNLGLSTGISTPGSTLVLEAGNNINLGTGTGNGSILGGPGWSIVLEAGRDFSVANTVVPGSPKTAAAGTVQFGIGSIVLAGASTVQTQDGSISVLAGNGVTVGTGAIRTMGIFNPNGTLNTAGGNIDVDAVSGSVNAGNNPNGFLYSATLNALGLPYSVSTTLGGISTGAGGNININAGGDVKAFMPSGTQVSDAGVGAFGNQPGVVNITAGGTVSGHFVAMDSTQNGQIVASTIVDNGGDTGLLALSMAKAKWEVDALNGSINLLEVRNPNGDFNNKRFGTVNPYLHFFDYDPGSSVTLTAGNSVNLSGFLGQNVPRIGRNDLVPIIYPSILKIHTILGGVFLPGPITLFPSSVGELTINTTGSLSGPQWGTAGFLLSDSAPNDNGGYSWSTTSSFPNDHAGTPVELNDPNPYPVSLDIGGDMSYVTITSPAQAQIIVHGDMINSTFSGQNLHAGDTTKITVTGEIFNSSGYAFTTLADPLSAPVARYPGDQPSRFQDLIDAVVPGSINTLDSQNRLFTAADIGFIYDPTTRLLGYAGIMSSTVRAELEGPLTVIKYGPNGLPLLNPDGTLQTTMVNFAVPAAAIDALYNEGQSPSKFVPVAPQGSSVGYLTLAGPGTFMINAGSMDLGQSAGITTVGPSSNPALAKQANIGASINLDVKGNLSMISSTIATEFGGDLTVTSDTGTITIGERALNSGNAQPYGIYTVQSGDVSVEAAGDINVAGSRIAAYDGGKVSVKSDTGNVDAGSGGLNLVQLPNIRVDPVTGQVFSTTIYIPGSGILATTLTDAPKNLQVGDITVTTPQGSIIASSGGISQIAQNGNTSLLPTVTLTAGTQDQNNHVIYAGDINAGNSGVIGINTVLKAAGNITGLVVARGNSTVNATANVSGTFLAGGSATFNVSSTSTISGTVIAGGGINSGTGSFNATAFSANVNAGGAQSALATTTATSSTATSAAGTATSQASQNTGTDLAQNDEDLKKRKLPVVKKTVGRVTVILSEK